MLLRITVRRFFLVQFQIISYAKPVPPFVQTGGEVQNGGSFQWPAPVGNGPGSGPYIVYT